MGFFKNSRDKSNAGKSDLEYSGTRYSRARQAGEMDVCNDVIELIGNTPLVRVDRIAKGLPPTVLAKIEYLNPGGSIKDRPALTMIEDAERKGLLKPGGTIVEPTSGNTGVGLAIVAARRGYKCVFICPDKVAPEKIAQLRAYGAEVVVCPTAVEPDDPRSYYSVSARLATEIEGAFKPDQYSNPANPQAHYETTGPEIWEQTAGKVTHLVAGVGTAGTIGGISRYLKERNRKIQIIGADPEGSVYGGGTGHPYLVEGVGEDFFPGNYKADQIDRIVTVSDAESFAMAKQVTLEEGIFIGGSGGMAVAAALKVAADASKDDVIVVILPDSGRGYLSKIYNDDWMLSHGFMDASIGTPASAGAEARDVAGDEKVAKLIGDTAQLAAKLARIGSKQTVREAVDAMRNLGLIQILVVDSVEDRPALGEVKGSLNQSDVLDLVASDSSAFNKQIAEVMSPRPSLVGVGEAVATAVERLRTTDAVLAVDAGFPVGVITQADVVNYFGSKN